MNENAPVEYTWKQTYSTKDKQPFGCYAFDKIVAASWEKGYTHNYKSIEDIDLYDYPDIEYQDSFFDSDSLAVAVKSNLLIIANNLYLEESTVEKLLKYVEKGGSALIAAEYFSGKLGDTLNLSTSEFNLIWDYLPQISREEPNIQVSLFSSAGEEVYHFPQKLIRGYFETSDTIKSGIYLDSAYILSENHQKKILSLRYHIGKGNLILVSNPTLFTNYEILNDSLNVYLRRHLAYLKDRPLIRTEYYEIGSQGDRDQSELRMILSERPLKWAFYLTMAAIVIFMFFTAKRKQKPIPIVKPPVNRMLDFVQSIAGLYLQKNSNADLLMKKQIYWGDKLKQKYGIDIMNEVRDYEFYKRVAAKTRQTLEDTRRLFIRLSVIDENTFVSDKEMMQLITKMNDFVNEKK
jgi:hypothetical protein